MEAQPTSGYTSVSNGTSVPVDANGVNTAVGLVDAEDTDNDGTPDYIDTDSDNGLGDTEGNDATESGNPSVGETYDNPDGSITDTASILATLTNTDSDTSDADYRSLNAVTTVDTDGDSIPDSIDLDDDNDGILDTEEQKVVAPTGGLVQPDAVFYTQGSKQVFTISGNTNGLGFQESGWDIAVTNAGGSIQTIADWTSPSFANGTVSVSSDAGASSPSVASTTTSAFASGDSGSALTVSPGDPSLETDGNLTQTTSIDFTTPVYAFGFDLIDIFDHGEANSFSDVFEIIVDGEVVWRVSGNSVGSGLTGTVTLEDGQGNVQGTITVGQNNESFVGFTSIDSISQIQIRSTTAFNSGNFGEDVHGIDSFRFVTNQLFDTDGDGIQDHLDLDSDNDGISDLVESGADAATLDPDNDGTINGAQFLDDGTGTNSTAGDGLADAIETTNGAGTGTTPVDSEATPDGIADYIDLDSDNDGIPDIVEAQSTAGYTGSADGDVTDQDADGDGVIDLFDSNDGTTADFGGSFAIPNDDTDDTDNIPDYLDTDSDDDGTDDATEAGLTPGADANGDGIGDGINASYADPDGNVNAPLTDLTNTDSDATDADYRSLNVTPPTGPDTDSDGVTDDLDIDDDNDGILDVNEMQYVAPTDPAPTLDGVESTDFPTGYWLASYYEGHFGTPDGTYVPSDGSGNAGTPIYHGEAAFGFGEESVTVASDGSADSGRWSNTETPTSPNTPTGYVGTTWTATNPFYEVVHRRTITADGTINIGGLPGDILDDNIIVEINGTMVYGYWPGGNAPDPRPGPTVGTDIPVSAGDEVSIRFVNLGFIGGYRFTLDTPLEHYTTIDSDGDGVFDHLDLDSDNDGIPDNLEAQTTQDYIQPTGSDSDQDGLDNAYDQDDGIVGRSASIGLTPVNTDGTDNVDYLDLDSDNDGTNDIDESGLGLTDSDGDGQTDGTVGANGLDDTVEPADDYSDVNGNAHDGTNFALADSDSDTADDGSDAAPTTTDFDYRDDVVPTSAVDTDGDGVANTIDIDDDNDGIIDTDEEFRRLALVNANFSDNVDPANANTTFGSAPTRSFQFDSTDVPGWSTTAADDQIEIWESGHLGVTSQSGAHFAEIHSNDAGEQLFQDITVQPGDIVEYSIWHRGRHGLDEADILLGAPGALVVQQTMATDDTDWIQYTGTYTVPDDQTTLRLAFQAISSSSPQLASGNFIDNLEVTITRDADVDGIPDYLDLDSDNDGISDLVESGADAATLDPDNDGTIDGAQFLDDGTGTNSTAGDGLADAIETTNGAGTGTTPVDSEASP